MAKDAATKPAETEEKSKKKGRFPKIKEFPTKLAWFDHMIKMLTAQREEYIKFGDGDKKKAVDKARKFVGSLDEMAKDPAYAAILAEIREKVAKLPAPPPAPVAKK